MTETKSPRIFPERRFSIDKILERPYTSETPFGSTGDRVWASSPQEWAFAKDIQLLEITNTSLFDLDIRSGPIRFGVNRAVNYPSHVHIEGAPFSGSIEEMGAAGIKVIGDKWITSDDVLVSQITMSNSSKNAQPYNVKLISAYKSGEVGFHGEHDLHGHKLQINLTGFDGKKIGKAFKGSLKPGEKKTLTFAAAVSDDFAKADLKLMTLFEGKDPLAEQKRTSNGWYDKNIAHFECSDPWVQKMYYHRWYTLKKNAMDPKIGTLQHRAFAEGRWRVGWYPYPITYGAAHQIRESRWLRDPSYCWGEIQTWMDNQRPDGIYPGRLEINGDRELIYTDWITSAVWDAYMVHPSRGLLSNIADKLAANVTGLVNKYGWKNSPLLVMPSHWFTGMEYQPSYFSFTGYHADKDENQTPLRRVDFTSYNFGNARAVEQIYREVGRSDDASQMKIIADATKSQTLSKMWNSETNWFHSLRASDNVKAAPKEIVGLYPFYFNLPPKGVGYEAAWDTALSKDYFWTKWPLASVAMDCPVYAQQGWPIGAPFASACMWNGPSWPHANSIVMTAMANVLRNYDKCAVTREKLYELFHSFTKVQFKNGDIHEPWTGEFYNGDTGEWKTGERDYNHSTYNDILIGDLIGIVPRKDHVLEIDPLLPKGAWSHYLLDGQEYKHHDVTVVYDSVGGRYIKGWKGYAVYLDGKRIFTSTAPKKMLYDMVSGKLLK